MTPDLGQGGSGVDLRNAGLKNVKVTPYTVKGIASCAAGALVSIANALHRIADQMEASNDARR